MSISTWYVLPLDTGWLVQERTATRGEVLPSKSTAIARAAQLAREAAPARYLVRRADGSIEREVRLARAAAPNVETLIRRNRRTDPAAPTSKRLRRSRRVLLVDDEPLVRASFGRLLSAHGWEVILAGDRSEAEAALSEVSISVAVIDLSLAESIALAGGLLDHGRADRVVFFTGHTDLDETTTQALGPLVYKRATQELIEALEAQVA